MSQSSVHYATTLLREIFAVSPDIHLLNTPCNWRRVIEDCIPNRWEYLKFGYTLLFVFLHDFI